jgi:hypothetical protein
MTKKILAVAAVTLALAAAAYAQPPYSMTNLWKVDAGGTFSWFTTGDGTRGLTYNPATDTVLVVTRTGGNAVYRLDPATGSAKTPASLDVTGVATGTFPVNLINPLSDGKLILTNMASATSTFKIYTYTSESATPTNSYNEANVTVRYGDSASVKGSGSNIQVLVSGSGTPTVAVFSSTDSGASFTKQDITLDVPLAGIPYVGWDPTDSAAFFHRKANSGDLVTSLTRYVISGTNATRDTTFGEKLVSVSGGGVFDVKLTANSNLLIASPQTGAAANATNRLGYIHHLPSETLLAQTASGLEKTGGANANGNGSGAAYMDLAGKRAFFLYTNNSISAWQIPTEVASGVADWNLY